MAQQSVGGGPSKSNKRAITETKPTSELAISGGLECRVIRASEF